MNLLQQLTVALMAVAGCAWAQQTPVPSAQGNSPSAPQVTFKVSTSLVLMDVVATDHSGRPVTDLKVTDLRLLEDGKERPIKTMAIDRAETGGAARAKLALEIKETIAKLPKNVSTNLGSLIASPNGSVSTVVLMDALNTQFAARAYARQEMLQLLKKLDPKQPVAVYGLTNSLRLLQDFTTNPAELQAAVAKVGARAALMGVNEGDLIDHSGSDLMGGEVPDQIYAQVREFEADISAQQLDDRVQRTLDGLQSIGRRLQSVPGRKNLIWLSGSFPLDLYPDNNFMSQSARHYGEKLAATLTVLENARVAIYPVSANGLQTDPTFAADRNPSGFRRNGAQAIADASQQWRAQTASTDDTMKLVAERTGGRAFFNRNDLGNAVQSAMEDGGSYYSLAFTPSSEEADGKLHKLKLTTARKGVDLRYRRGYISMDSALPSKERVQFMREEMSNALTDTQQLSSGVLIYAQPATDGKGISLIVDARFLTLAHADNGQVKVQFQVATATFDQKGNVLKSRADVVSKEFKTEDVKRLLELGAHFEAPIEKTDAVRRVRVAVRDLATDRIGTVDVKLD